MTEDNFPYHRFAFLAAGPTVRAVDRNDASQAPANRISLPAHASAMSLAGQIDNAPAEQA
jgi:hypothetical protein